MDIIQQIFSLLALVSLFTPGVGADQRTARRSQDIKHAVPVEGIFSIGAIVDTSSRIGKEQAVAMEVAKEDFHCLSNRTFLHINDSQKEPIGAALAAKDLINVQHVQAILGPRTWEELSIVAEIASEKQVPILSFADTTPEWATKRWSSLLQASHNKYAQMKAIAAIVQSWNWHQATVIYEDNDSIGVVEHLYDALRDKYLEVTQFLALPPFASPDLLSKELETIKRKQSRVFVVHMSLSLAGRLFEKAKKMKMMEEDYVWITTDPITSLFHSINSSAISSMNGVTGVRVYFPKIGRQFENFNQRFRQRFRKKYPEEEKNDPGIYAVQAYDAMWAISLALEKESRKGGKELLEKIRDAEFDGLSGKIKFRKQKVSPTEMFEIVNVTGMGYVEQLGFWSDGLGFSKIMDANGSIYNSSRNELGQVYWQGGSQQHPSRGWTTSPSDEPLKIGVPSISGYKEYVKVEHDSSGTNFSGLTIEVFEATIRSLPFSLPYKFYDFNGTYDQLVQQIHVKKFDAVVGDVEIVGSRYAYAEFTHPYTETGLVMIVPARSSSKAWSFIKPFSTTMWLLISAITLYNGFVLWWIERRHCAELQGSIPNQIGIMLWLSFNTLFSLQGEKLHSSLSRMSVVVWLFVALVIIQTYTANLTSMMTVQRLEPTIPSVEALLNSNAMVGHCTGSYMATYLAQVLNFKPENMKQYYSAEEYASGFKKKEIDAAFIGTPYAKLFLAKYCNRFIQVGPTYKIGGFGFAFPHGSPLLPSINKALLSISENGTLGDLEKKWITPEECQDKVQSDENSSLGPNGFRVLFFVSGGTATSALLIHMFRISYVLMRTKYLWRIMSAVLKHWYCSPTLRRRFGVRSNV